MRRLSLITIIMLMSTVFLLGNDGCGLSSGTCSFDSDCLDDQACVQSTCRRLCQGDEDCATEADVEPVQTCQPYSNASREDTINVCALPNELDKDKNNENDCQNDQQCQMQLNNEDARCSLAKTCFIPRQEYALYIEDTSQTDSVTLLAAYLIDDQKQTIGYGVSAGYLPVGDQPAAQPMTGRPPVLREDKQCTQDVTAPRLPLGGAGGAVQVSFVNDQGQRMDFAKGWSVVLITLNQNCDDQITLDNEYTVKQCVLRSGEQLDPQTHCATELGSSVQGVATFEIKL